MTETNLATVAGLGCSSEEILSMLRAGDRIEINGRSLALCRDCNADPQQMPACKTCEGRGVTNADGSVWDGK